MDDISRRSVLKGMAGTAAAVTGAGCISDEEGKTYDLPDGYELPDGDDVQREAEKAIESVQEHASALFEKDIPDSFKRNRELIHENQKRMLREHGYDDVLDLETLETGYDSMDDVPEQDSIDLTTHVKTQKDSEYGHMRDDLQGLGGVKTLRDIGTAMATMLHAAVGSYALDDPIAEEPDLYQQAMDGMGFGVRSHDDSGLSVYLYAEDVEAVEQVYEEHGKDAGWVYAQKTIYDDLLN